MMAISGLNHTARSLAVYASQPGSPRHHARLASGRWPSSAGRGWLPAGFQRKVSALQCIPLSQAFLAHPLLDSPGGGTGRRAGLRRTCPRGVGVRISPRRLNPFQAGRCPAGPHKPGVPGSIPGPGTCGWAGAQPSFIRSEAEVRLPDPQLSVFTARYANWHRGQVESLVPVGSNPTRATDRNSSRRLAAKTPVLHTG
jgi:hypothetical protein